MTILYMVLTGNPTVIGISRLKTITRASILAVTEIGLSILLRTLPTLHGDVGGENREIVTLTDYLK